MFQQPLMMMPEQEELTLDQKLKQYKDKRINDELKRALRRSNPNKQNTSKNLFNMLQNETPGEKNGY
jgi:hypothetical protein